MDANDIALFSCSREGLQVQDYLAEFCKPRGLEVNVNKTRVVVFARHKRLRNPSNINSTTI